MAADFTQLDRLLDLIERHIDLEHCAQVDARYRRALTGAATDRPPLIVQADWAESWALPRPWSDFEHYAARETYDDPIAMMQNDLLERVVPGLILKDDNPLAIRNNHGTIQVASLLGGRWEMRGDNPPWIIPWNSADAVRALLERRESVDLDGGVTDRSLATLRFYREQLDRFPACRKAIQISLPDLQGPFDTAEQLWGSGIMMTLLEQPELVSALLAKIVEATVHAEQLYRPYTYDRLEPLANTQHGYNIPGRLLIRNDSSILVSAATYRDVIAPQDAQLLHEVGGGSIHFCGNGEHLIEPMLEIPDLKGLDFGESWKMDMHRIYRACRERGVAITNYTPSREELVDGSVRRDFPTGIVIVYLTHDIDDAREVVQAYQRTLGTHIHMPLQRKAPPKHQHETTSSARLPRA